MVCIDFKDKVVVVTGGLKGIGRCIADLFLSCGAKVVIGDIRCEGGINKENNNLLTVKVDVTNKSDVETMINAAVDHFGGLDVIVNNAGISTMDYVVDIKEEDWDKVLDINAKGVFLCSQYAAKVMLGSAKGGRIINMASQAGKNGYRCMANYCASKHAVIGLTKVMAVELAKHNILVNAVCPGIVETDMKLRERVEGAKLRGITSDDIKKEDNSQVPLGRTAEPIDIANVVLFLASNLSSYMTGQAINVTGGMTMN